MAQLIRKESFDFSFNPDACKTCGGKCCTGQSGYIWVKQDEIEKICKFLQIPQSSFLKLYLDKIGYKFSLREFKYKDGYACVFFDTKKKECEIYEVRPNQCRTFPFWDYFKTNIKEAQEECPGILF